MSAIRWHNIQVLWSQLTYNGISYKVALSKRKTITKIYSATIAVRCRFMEWNVWRVCTCVQLWILWPTDQESRHVCHFIWLPKWCRARSLHHPGIQSDVIHHWWCTTFDIVTHLDTVLKPVSGFKMSIKEPTPNFWKLPQAYTHIWTDSMTSSPTFFVGDLNEALLPKHYRYKLIDCILIKV